MGAKGNACRTPIAMILRSLKMRRELSKYGSRGRAKACRSLVETYRELSYVEKEAGDRPVLLLDDIFSELDEKCRHLVLDVIGKQQTIITSAEDNMVDLVRRAKGMQPMIIQLYYVNFPRSEKN